MVKCGIGFAGTIPPGDAEQREQELVRHQIWAQVNQLIKWGRLYGVAIAVLITDGQNPSQPSS